MDDRSDKIAALAHEMVRTNMVLGPAAPAAKIAMSFRTLCLATLLAAAGGAAVVEWDTQSTRLLNRYEKTELKALVFYAAREKNLSEQDILSELHAKFHVANFDDMSRRDFLAVRHYLQDKAQ